MLNSLRHAASAPPTGAETRVVGIDDWAWKKGSRYGTIIVDLERREVLDVLPDREASTTEAWLSRHPGVEYIARDRDGVYGAVVTRRLRAMGIRDKPISAGSPWQNCYAERLIGTIRRECVDHLIVLGEAHLRRVVVEFAAYYNSARTHGSLDKDAPVSRPVQRIGRIVSHAMVGGLHHQYVRI